MCASQYLSWRCDSCIMVVAAQAYNRGQRKNGLKKISMLEIRVISMNPIDFYAQLLLHYVPKANSESSMTIMTSYHNII